MKTGRGIRWIFLVVIITGTSAVLLERNCSTSITLRAESGNCTTVDGYTTGDCKRLSDYLDEYNDGTIAANDCLQIKLLPGNYTLDSMRATNITYSLVLVAVDKEATLVSCLSADETLLTLNSPLWFQKIPSTSPASITGELFVEIEGVKFHNCPRPLRFDTMDYVGISNCTFMSVIM